MKNGRSLFWNRIRSTFFTHHGPYILFSIRTYKISLKRVVEQLMNKKPTPPKSNHPWRKQITTSEVNRWAKEKSGQTKVNNFRIGQLKK